MTRTWNSLHARLILGAALWITAAITISDVAIAALFRQHVTAQFMHELSDHLTELESLAAVSRNEVSLIRPLSDPRFIVPSSGFYWEITRPDGTVMLKSRSLATDEICIEPVSSLAAPRGAHLLFSPIRLRVVERFSVAGDSRSSLRFVVAANQAKLDAVLHQFNRLLKRSLALLGIGLLGAAGAQVIFGLRPMRRLRRALGAVRAGEAEDLPSNFPEEVAPLVSDLNSMIQTNQDMVRRARAQAGNLAHALRGPLAILADETRQLREAGCTGPAEILRQQCEVMTRQIDYQIARARAAATRAGPQAHSYPAATAGVIISAIGRLHAARALIYENDLSQSAAVACDTDDLNEMLANIIDNATKWAVSRVRIRDAPSPRAKNILLIVEDDGPGVPADDRERVFGLGERLDEEMPGSGLGLSIVRDLSKLYGGNAYMEASVLGGTAAVLELPRAQS